MITKEDVIYFYEQFKKNLDEEISLTESSISDAESIDSIVEYVQDKKVGLQNLFKRNNELIEKYITPIMKSEEPLTEELIDTLLEQILEYCKEGYTEPVGSAVVLRAIERHYDSCPKEELDIDNLLRVYHLLGFCGHDIMKNDKGYENGINYCKKMLRYKDDFFNIKSSYARRILLLAQHNICAEMVSNIDIIVYDDSIDICEYQKELMQYLDDAIAIYNDERIRDFVKDDFDFETFIEATYYKVYGNALGKLLRSENILPEFLKKTDEKITEIYNENLKKNPDITAIGNSIVCNYWLCQVLYKRIEVEKYVDIMMDYFKNTLVIEKIPSDVTVYDSQYFETIVDKFDDFLYVLYKSDIDDIRKEEITIYCVEKYLEMMEWLPKTKASTRINGILELSARNFIKYLPPQIPKYNFILKILVNRDESVSLHGVMVRQLSYYILNAILEEKPELLIGTLKTENVMDVLVKQEEIVDFARKSSMIFDIGKIFYSEIVQKDTRKLLPLEYKYIKMHPINGAKVIEHIEGLEDFIDIVLGHHKYYDGTGGYPEEYDNTKSKNKFIVDLIRICDCMDAATDDIGRTYKNPITFDKFLEQLQEGAGTLYNPDIVSFICNDEKLKKELKECCTYKRIRSYFETVYGHKLADSKEVKSEEIKKNQLPIWTRNALRVLEVDFYKDTFRTIYRGSLSMEGSFKDGQFSKFNIDDYEHLFTPEDRFIIKQFLDYGTLADKLSINNGTFELETRIRSGEGYRWIRFQVVTTLEHFGIPQKILIIMLDADEKCRKRQKLQETLELVKEEAKEANKAKSLFISNISHEIRTPMNAIVGMVEILLRSNLSDEQKSYLMNIKNSGNALLTIINDILDFSKMESGKFDIIEIEYDMMSMLNEISMIFLNRIGEKPVYLNFDIDKNIPKVLYGDSLRVRQVIINLMNNAIKFTDKGMVTLSIEVANVEDTDIELLIKVKDSGIGIKEEDMSKLFGQFQQIDIKKNYEKEGTGLGLVISKQLVELMGGKISVSSVYGEGSEFTFNIKQKIVDNTAAAKIDENKVPKDFVVGCFSNIDYVETVRNLCSKYQLEFKDLCAEDGDADLVFTDANSLEKVQQLYGDTRICIIQNPMLESISHTGIRSTNSPLYSAGFCCVVNDETEQKSTNNDSAINYIAPKAKILIVDDTAMNLTVAKGLLAPLRMTIDTASSGMRAIEMLQHNKDYDLIFMDHKMPDMDGVDTTVCIRTMDDEYYKKVPIIALTANAVLEARQLFFECGMNDFLSKPIVVKDIMQMIRKWLPKDYIEEVDPSEVTLENEVVKIPESIEGINVSEALKNAGGPDLLATLLCDYYKLIDSKSSKIRDYLAEGMIKEYTIEVHAMKSVSRVIGALELSDEFKELEALGDKEEVDALYEKTPVVLEHYQNYKTYLKEFVDSQESRKEKNAISKGELIEILEIMSASMQSCDLDMVDECMNKLDSCEIPDEVKTLFDQLSMYVADVNMEESIKIMTQMSDTLR